MSNGVKGKNYYQSEYSGASVFYKGTNFATCYLELGGHEDSFSRCSNANCKDWIFLASMENNHKLQSYFGNISKIQNSICYRIRTKEHSIVKTRSISKQERSRLRTNESVENVEKRIHSDFFY